MNGFWFRSYKLAFLLPGLLILVAIILFPLLFTIVASFTSWDAVTPGLNGTGLSNYAAVLQDQRFWEAFARLALIAVATVTIEYLLGLGLALLVWREVRLKRFFRVLFLIPMMTTPVVMSVVWRTLLHESLGPANHLLAAVGIEPVPWLSAHGPALASVMIVEIWQWTPFMFLLLLAGLLSLPREPFLAAAIDGAGPVRTFFNVTWPSLMPVSVGAIVIRLIEASKIMDTIYVLTSGGPGTATETSGYYIYIRGLRDFEIGYGSALSITYLVVMTLALTLIAKLLARFAHGEGA
ncbi:sugar ABC transporter permease [Aquabacterium sp. A7-Y]|uniref:carbohydrate ABC transporter permease n=1 Tax=Aquabacterium sp. A7-Y TaxID=1349605 RepID=UPI00223D37F9|nr:sugar ABC transporter permease [Aquabacterium sp. A7-Y]MCW7541357.1 sugar ABC transporter permease [Aquabacterium sp. A7-Y]